MQRQGSYYDPGLTTTDRSPNMWEAQEAYADQGGLSPYMNARYAESPISRGLMDAASFALPNLPEALRGRQSAREGLIGDIGSLFAAPLRGAMGGGSYAQGLFNSRAWWQEQLPEILQHGPSPEAALSFMPFGGVAQFVNRTPEGGLIKAFSNEGGQAVGELGYRALPGAASIRNIRVDPAARGQGYATEMLDLLGKESKGNLRLGSDITNSMPFWERAAQKFPSLQEAVQYMKGGW